MKILGYILYLAAIFFCVAGFMGHVAAWPVVIVCFFAATMLNLAQRKK